MMNMIVFFLYYLELFILGSIFVAMIAICGTTKYTLTTFIIFLGVLAYYYVINAKIRNITKAIVIVIIFTSILLLLLYVTCETASATGNIPLWSELVANYLEDSKHLDSARQLMKTVYHEATSPSHPLYEDKKDCMERINYSRYNLEVTDNEAVKYYGKTVSSELGKEPEIPTSNKRGMEDSSLGPNKR